MKSKIFTKISNLIYLIKNKSFKIIFEKINIKLKKNTFNTFTPYLFLTLQKTINVKLISKKYIAKNIKTNFSTVTPVYNEKDSIHIFLNSLKKQTLKPNKIIIVDTGSSDNTPQLINNFIKKNKKLNIELVQSNKRLGISEGRNKGAKKVNEKIIVFIDAGNRFDKNFLCNLIGPLDNDSSLDLSAPIALPFKKYTWTNEFLPDWEHMSWLETYLPAARGVAVNKDKFNKIRGFPEHLKWSGEDTIFMINYRKISKNWIINKQSICYWFGPDNRQKADALHKRYGVGDGINGYSDGLFYPNYKNWKYYEIFPNYNFFKNKYDGYLEGKKNRSEIEINDRKIKIVNIILSKFPITNNKGKDKTTISAIKHANKNEKVFFININKYFEKKPSNNVFINADFSLIELYNFDDFKYNQILPNYKKLTINLEYHNDIYDSMNKKIDLLKKYIKKIQE